MASPSKCACSACGKVRTIWRLGYCLDCLGERCGSAEGRVRDMADEARALKAKLAEAERERDEALAANAAAVCAWQEYGRWPNLYGAVPVGRIRYPDGREEEIALRADQITGITRGIMAHVESILPSGLAMLKAYQDIEGVRLRAEAAEARVAALEARWNGLGCEGAGGWGTGQMDVNGNEIEQQCHCPACNGEELAKAFKLWSEQRAETRERHPEPEQPRQRSEEVGTISDKPCPPVVLGNPHTETRADPLTVTTVPKCATCGGSGKVLVAVYDGAGLNDTDSDPCSDCRKDGGA